MKTQETGVFLKKRNSEKRACLYSDPVTKPGKNMERNIGKIGMTAVDGDLNKRSRHFPLKGQNQASPQFGLLSNCGLKSNP